MPRPKKCRRVCGPPRHEVFGPQGAGGSMTGVNMSLDEYETIRLIDLLGQTQEECARQMEVARTTVQAMYDSARKKLADALVNGRNLYIRGGAVRICPHRERCAGGSGCRHRPCINREHGKD